jgi:ketosteroid isomerase-like protein
MQKSKGDLITSAYAAFNRRDIDSVLALMVPDVDWPNGMEGGRVIGQDQVRSYWKRQWEVLNPSVDPISIEGDQDGRVMVRVHQVVRDLSGNVLVDHFVQHVYSFKDDLIDRMDIREAPETDRAEDVSSERV